MHRAELGEATADELAEADWTLEAQFSAALARVGLDEQPDTPLASLSGGQQTRARLAALIFAEPDFLLLDEPTNNLDRAGRLAVLDLLAGWRKGAIIVSHDRDLLETVDAIVELSSLGAARYGGNWSHYRTRKSQELAAARAGTWRAPKGRPRQSPGPLRSATERKARKDSAGNKKAARGDMPKILAGARKDRSEGTSGANARLAAGSPDRSRGYGRRGASPCRDIAARLGRAGGDGAAGWRNGAQDRELGRRPRAGSTDHRRLCPLPSRAPSASRSPARTAPENRLFSLLTGDLPPVSGTVTIISRHAFLDQDVSLLDISETIRDNFRRLNPEAGENPCRSALARFMFRADAALLPVSSLSGGQMLRAGLACVLGGDSPPQLLILDEPTNHLDINSIEAVEAGLRAFDGALLVVSHDETFLEAIGITRRLEFPLGPTS